MLREALEHGSTTPDEPNSIQGDILNELALTVHYDGDYESAEPLFQEALALQRQHYGQEHPTVAISLHNLASLLHDQGDHAAAEPLYTKPIHYL